MKKILPIILILLGVGEIVIAFMGVRMPLPVAIVLGALFIVVGVKEFLMQVKRSDEDR